MLCSKAGFKIVDFEKSLVLLTVCELEPMPDEERSSRHQRRGRSPSDSDRRQESQRSSKRGEGYDYDGRKRYRSRSRDRPRKRRSSSPGDRDDVGVHRKHDRSYDRRERDHGRRSHRRRQSRSPSTSPPRRKRSLEPLKRSKGPLPSQQDAFQKDELAVVKPDAQQEKDKPNFGNTGRLAAASNTVQTAGQTIILKYHEPSEARKPSGKDQWRMYVFKGDEIVETIELAEQSCWLFGREAAVVDVLIEHSSCSKQHAVLQFRYLEKRNEFGDKRGKVRPYVLDLESANGTAVNGDLIPEAKYVELRDKDVVKFGHSSREYVMQLPPST